MSFLWNTFSNYASLAKLSFQLCTKPSLKVLLFSKKYLHLQDFFREKFLKNPYFSSQMSKNVDFLKIFGGKSTFRPRKTCVITVIVRQVNVLLNRSFPEVLCIESHFFGYFYTFFDTWWSYFLKILHIPSQIESSLAKKIQKVFFQRLWYMSLVIYEKNYA